MATRSTAAMTETANPAARAAPAPEGAAFRDAMSQVASAVHVVTTFGVSGRAGLTATAVASVSDAPPTVLVCIEGASRTLAAIVANGIFCINTLAGDQQELAEIFASRRGVDGEARFASAGWEPGITGAPMLRGSVASFDCRLLTVHKAATHRILIGEVVGLGGTTGRPGLIYRRRHFESV